MLPLLDVVEGSGCIFLVHEAVPMSLEDVIRCAPHTLVRTPGLAPASSAPMGTPLLPQFSHLVNPVPPTLTTAALFLVYQLLQLLKHCHERGVTHGALSPHVIRVLTSPAPSCWKTPASLWLQLGGFSAPVPPLLPEMAWADAVRLWQTRALSNYHYLLWVNEAAGRRWGDPDLHPLLPWVTDFSAPSGLRRDLTRTKFRLTKGDEQLDQTYTAAKAGRRHHVSDMLNVLSFYTYKARRVPVAVLQKHVRANFQPSEYPANMSRLYASTPHEAIPEFYTDPDLFRSTHADMPDLAVPEWASSPEDFIAQHRALLESDAVSAQLHLWLDITFGNLVRGPDAVAVKNVPLVDPQLPFNGGFVQLFAAPHPRRFPAQQADAAVPPDGGRAITLAPSKPHVLQPTPKPMFSLFGGPERGDSGGPALGLGKLIQGLTGGSKPKTRKLLPAEEAAAATAVAAGATAAGPPDEVQAHAATENRFVAGLLALERTPSSHGTSAALPRPPTPTPAPSSVALGPRLPSPSASTVSLASAAARREVTNVNVSGAGSYACSVQEDLDAVASIIAQLYTRSGQGALVDVPAAELAGGALEGPVQGLLAALAENGLEGALAHSLFPPAFGPVYRFMSGFMQHITVTARLQHALAGLPALQDEEHLPALVFPFLLPLFRALPVPALPLFSYLARWRWPAAAPYWKNLQVPLEEMYQKRELVDLQANILAASFVDLVWRLFPLQSVLRRFVPFLFDALRSGGPHAGVAAGAIRQLVRNWGPVLAMNHLITPLFGFLGRVGTGGANNTPAAVGGALSNKAVDVLAELARDLGDAFVATHFLPLLTDALIQFSARSARAESGLSQALELLMRLLEVLSGPSLLRLLQPPATGSAHSPVLLCLLLNPPPYAQAILSLAVILVTLAHRLGPLATLTHVRLFSPRILISVFTFFSCFRLRHTLYSFFQTMKTSMILPDG